jgi:hypothetical protein
MTTLDIEILYPADHAGYFVAQVTLDVNEVYLDDVDAWCEQTFGPQDVWGSAPVTGWKRMFWKYCFTDEEMLSMFVLRWTGENAQ